MCDSDGQLRLLGLAAPIAVLAWEIVGAAEVSSDRQRAADAVLDRVGVSRTVAARAREVARQALVERLLAIRGAAQEQVGVRAASLERVQLDIGDRIAEDKPDDLEE